LQIRTIDGEKKWSMFYGFVARIIQYEVDHLDGKLFTDRAYKLVTVPRGEWQKFRTSGWESGEVIN
jgi:peptide deformylase